MFLSVGKRTNILSPIKQIKATESDSVHVKQHKFRIVEPPISFTSQMWLDLAVKWKKNAEISKKNAEKSKKKVKKSKSKGKTRY